jgi:hypothetical protein
MHGSYNRDIERVLSERDNFNMDSQIIEKDNYPKKSYTKSRGKSRGKSYGEITGDLHKHDDYAKGMPVRPQCTFTRQVYDGNSHLDFDIYDQTPVITREIEYNDPDNNEFCSTKKISHTLTDNIKPTQVCINTINAMTLNLFNTISQSTKIMFNINGLGLYMGLLELYHGSAGNTEIELKSYCNFVERIKTYGSFRNFISKYAEFLFPQISFRSYILYDSEMKLSRKYKRDPLNQMVPIISINVTDNIIENERKKINKIINKETECFELMSSNTLHKVELNIVSVIRINPIWGIKVDSLSSGKFMGDNTVFINFSNCNIGYYELNNTKYMEIPMKGNDIVFGIIMSSIIDYENFDSIISKIQLVNVKNLLIPKIVKRTKLRLNNVIKSTGIQACFLQTELPDIFPEDDNRISDILQYSDLILDEKCQNTKQHNRINNRIKKIRSIVVNNEFIYYIRYIPNNLVLCAGKVTI